MYIYYKRSDRIYSIGKYIYIYIGYLVILRSYPKYDHAKNLRGRCSKKVIAGN